MGRLKILILASVLLQGVFAFAGFQPSVNPKVQEVQEFISYLRAQHGANLTIKFNVNVAANADQILNDLDTLEDLLIEGDLSELDVPTFMLACNPETGLGCKPLSQR